jgi:hypothetical protein
VHADVSITAILKRRWPLAPAASLVPDPAASEQVAALPNKALAAFAEVLDLLQLVPRGKGSPQSHIRCEFRRASVALRAMSVTAASRWARCFAAAS